MKRGCSTGGLRLPTLQRPGARSLVGRSAKASEALGEPEGIGGAQGIPRRADGGWKSTSTEPLKTRIHNRMQLYMYMIYICNYE